MYKLEYALFTDIKKGSAEPNLLLTLNLIL